MIRHAKRIVLIAFGIVAAMLGLVATESTVDGAVRRQALKSNSLTGIRDEALSLFPRGSRLQPAATRLVDMGFTCEPLKHAMPDISGPSLICSSSGRGYPDYPAINVTLVTRNGLISDIEVWNMMGRADGSGDDVSDLLQHQEWQSNGAVQDQTSNASS
ncbi:hypothetical protein [Lichenifustis flavocetrariae]|uniref:Uncharacterized protein n=1 Tax=Lichenifustis flavocetrariae TaxID=2949735 RepID=A0AA42CIU0_9HYPH|nr:hypothetical protein [Lichenifustis flavocetrariae]MCW6507246.1 hypothetical protein [Lichenifustis flavocetrariae]